MIRVFDRIINCRNAVKTIRLNWMAIIKYFFKWLPFSIAVGVASGITASLFDYLLVEINFLFMRNDYIILMFALIVALVTGYVINFLPETAGPGINFVLKRMDDNGVISIKSTIYKFFISVFALSGVFMAGREGVSVFMGAGISSFLSRYFGIGSKFKDYAILIGAGAFTGALLKAPLGGALFALELKYVSDMDYRPFAQTIVASITSYTIFSLLRGSHTFIQLSQQPVWQFSHIPHLVLLGVFVSLIIYIFVPMFYFANCVSSSIKPIYRPLSGTLVALPILYVLLSIHNVDFLSLSVNYGALSDILQKPFPVVESFSAIFLIIFFNSLTIGFGISGGMILPSLLIGALAGNIFGHFFPAELLVFTMAGMGAALSATSKTPLAAIVIITEMTHTDVVIPMTAAVIVSYILTFGLNIYSSQSACRTHSKSEINF